MSLRRRIEAGQTHLIYFAVMILDSRRNKPGFIIINTSRLLTELSVLDYIRMKRTRGEGSMSFDDNMINTAPSQYM